MKTRSSKCSLLEHLRIKQILKYPALEGPPRNTKILHPLAVHHLDNRLNIKKIVVFWALSPSPSKYCIHKTLKSKISNLNLNLMMTHDKSGLTACNFLNFLRLVRTNFKILINMLSPIFFNFYVCQLLIWLWYLICCNVFSPVEHRSLNGELVPFPKKLFHPLKTSHNFCFVFSSAHFSSKPWMVFKTTWKCRTKEWLQF